MNPDLKQFLDTLHPSTAFLGTGTATVMDREAEAILTRNLYGQEIVWGMFSVNRGKFKGNLANNANTEEVVFALIEVE